MGLDYTDKTGNNNILSATSATEYTASLPFAASTKAIDIAANQCLSAADSASLSLSGDMTLACWVRFDTVDAGGNNAILSKFNTTGNQKAYQFGLTTGNTLYFLTSTDGAADTDYDTVSWTPSVDTWYHLAVTRNTATNIVKFYVDGSQQGADQSFVTDAIFDSTAVFQIGGVGAPGTITNDLDAKVDDIRVYNSVITDFSNRSSELVGNEAGLVAYWPLEGLLIDLADKTSNGNDLSNYGAAEVSSSLPFANSSYAVDLEATQSNYLSAPDSASLSITGDITIETWVKFESLPASGDYMFIVSKYADSGDQRSYVLRLYNNTGTYVLQFQKSSLGTAATEQAMGVNWTPSTATWYHIAVSYTDSSKTAQFVVDGSQVGSDQVFTDAGIYNGTALLDLGSFNFSGGRTYYLDGMLDDTRIWNTARTITQINTNKSLELAGTESGLVAYWPYETSIGTTGGGEFFAFF